MPTALVSFAHAILLVFGVFLGAPVAAPHSSLEGLSGHGDAAAHDDAALTDGAWQRELDAVEAELHAQRSVPGIEAPAPGESDPLGLAVEDPEEKDGNDGAESATDEPASIASYRALGHRVESFEHRRTRNAVADHDARGPPTS